MNLSTEPQRAATVSKRQQRALKQRARILDAAQTCFAKHGFHGASMAMVAETAQMSTGLIYRYFESKSQIIQAIVERQLQWILQGIDTGRLLQQPPEDVFADRYQHCVGADGQEADEFKLIDPALFLEMQAEASRDEGIARALEEFDNTLDTLTENWLLGSDNIQHMDEKQRHARKFIARCLIDGLRVRELRAPDIDSEVLQQALRDAFGFIRRPPAD